jgi:hypothetical protein
VRIPIKATVREPSNRPDTYQRLPTARPQLRKAAGSYMWGTPPLTGEHSPAELKQIAPTLK